MPAAAIGSPTTARSITTSNCAKRLNALGYAFRTRFDTEVSLTVYAQCGTSALARPNGMFACCLWDAKAQAGFCRARPLLRLGLFLAGL